MSHGQIQIVAGAIYSNDLAPKYEEHRKVTSLIGGFVQYEIVKGKRAGASGGSRGSKPASPGCSSPRR